MLGRRPRPDPDAAVAALMLPEPVFRTCPWGPRALVEEGLRQWLRCAAPALRDEQTIGMPSRAVDEAWHGLILHTELYADFCAAAYGRLLHHRPGDVAAPPDPHDPELRRTVVAWTLVRRPHERCVLWDLDEQVGVPEPWRVAPDLVADVERATRL